MELKDLRMELFGYFNKKKSGVDTLTEDPETSTVHVEFSDGSMYDIRITPTTEKQ